MSNTQGGLPPQEGVTDSTNSKERDQTEDDDTTHSPEYNEKFKIVLSYKPFLETMIQRLEKATDKSREAQLIKMQSLYNILFNPTKQLKLGTILRCEKVLKSLYEKIEKSTLLPEEIKAVKEKVGSTVNASQDQTLLETNLQKSPINNSVETKKEDAITKTLTLDTNLNKEHKTINLNDSVKADHIKSPSKVNEESRRKLCNIIMKQRQEESPSKAVTNTNEEIIPVCKVSTPLPSPSNKKQIIEEKSSEMFNKQPNVFNSNKETTLKKQIDIISNKDKSVYDNILSHGDRMPFSSTATDDYSFESLDRDDSKRYLAWNEPNVIQYDQSLQREIIDLNMTNQKLPCLPAQQNLNIPKQKLPCLSVHQNIPNLSPNLSKSDKIDKSVHQNIPNFSPNLSKSDKIDKSVHQNIQNFSPNLSKSDKIDKSVHQNSPNFSPNLSKSDKIDKSVHQNIPNFSPNLSKSDKIDKNILGSHVQQENRYINLAQQAGTEMFSGSQHAAPCEKESANLNSFKSNIISEPSKLLSPESRPQSLREKLTEQISAVHKVGTSCGGALRGLVNREDKIITPTRMANLKAGTILDLIGQDKPHTSRMSHVKAKPNLGKLHDEMPKFQNIQINPNLGKFQSEIPTLHNIQTKPILGKLHDEMPKFQNIQINPNLGKLQSEIPTLHNIQTKPILGKLHDEMSILHSIPHPPQDHPSTVANNDITNSIGLTNLSFDNNSTLDALTKMNPKELERLVHDHILKLPGSSETIHSNVDKEQDFLNKKPNAEIDRGTLNRNCNNPNIRPLLQHSSDPRKGFHNVRTASNIPRYEAHVQRLPNSNQSGFSPFPQCVGGNIGNPLYNSQAPASNMAQSNQKFVYGAATHDNRSQTYNANIETNDYLHTGVYKNPELKVPENIGGRNSNPNTYVNYNNPPSELNTYSHSLNANANHYQQTSFNQSDPFKWSRRPSASTDSNTGYNALNRHSVIPTREDRTSNSEKHNSRSLTSQKPISIRDPRRKSVEETFNRSNSNRTEQSRNEKNFDPRLTRNPKRNSNDYVSNRDPRVRDSFSSSPHRQKSLHQKKSVENDFKTKGTFSSPLDKLYSTTSNSKTGKGYGPQKFKIPKLKSASSQKSDSSSKNQTSAINTSKNIKVRDINMKVDEHNEDNHFKCIKNETDKSIKNETEERSNKDSSPNHSIDKDRTKSDDSDEEIRPPRNSRHKRNRWDQTERDVDFTSKTSDDKKVVSKKRKTEVIYKSKDKVENEPKSQSIQKRRNEILTKPKDTVDSKQEIETEDQACSSNTTVNTVNEFRNKAISDSKDSEKEISSSVSCDKEISSTVSSEKEISSSVNSEGNHCSETKFKNEDLQNIFPSSLFDLLASEEKMKFFSKLGENLNAEKLKKIKRIIESNSDEEEDSTKTIPTPVTNEIPGPNTSEEDKKLTSSFSDEQLEDCRKSNEKSPSYQTKPFESDTKEEDKITENNQSVKNKQENVVQDLDSENSNILIKSQTTNDTVLKIEESHQENSCLGNNDSTIKCEIGLGESNKSLDAIENVCSNETLLSEKDLQPKKKPSPKKKYSKKGTNKKTIQKKTSNSSALDSVQNTIETTMKPKKKQKNELEKLQEDIRDMFISQGVVSATGMRLCRLKKTMDSAEGNDISNKEPVGSFFHENKSGRKSLKDKKTIMSEESDSSEEDTLETRDKKKTPVRRTSTKSLVSCKKSDKDSVSAASSDGSEDYIEETKDKKKKPVRRTSTKSLVSCKKSDKDSVSAASSDGSEDYIEATKDKKKTPVRRTSTKSSVSCKKSDKDSVSAASSDGSEDYIEETKDKKKSSVGRTSTKSSVSCKKSDKDSVSAANSDGSEDDIGETRDKKKTPVGRTSNKSSVSCKKNDKIVSSISVEEKIDSDCKEKSMKVGTDVSRCEAICSPRVVIRKTDFATFEKKASECVSVETQLEQTSDEENTIEKESSEAVIKDQSSSVDSANLSSMINNSINIDQGQIEKCLKAQQVLQKYDLKRKNRKKPKWQLGVLEKKRPRKKVEPIKDDCQEQKLKININDINYYQENENVMYKCKICSYEGKMIVRHYTTNHPGEEVMISRISPDSAKQATEESKNKQFNLEEDNLVDTKCKNKVFNCRMCSRTFSNAIIFFDHITFHTGEYRYECHVCKYRISSKSGLKSHLLASHNEGKKLGTELKATVYDDPPYSSIVLGFLCSECNFVQLISENMNKHLSSKHGENTSGQLPKAITINLSKPFVSNQENSNIDSICDTINKIDVISDNQIQTNEIDDGTDQFSDIKIEHPSDLTIIDVENMDTDENDGFEEDSTASQLENVIEPSSEDDLGTYTDQEEASNLQKQVALNVFLGYDDNDIKDSELNVERERIMNDIVTKLKTQTKPQKGSVLDQIKSKLTMSIIEHDSTPQISKKKDVSNENDSSRHKSAAKEKLVVMDDCFPEDSDVPVRRTLPERSCKDKGQGLYADENVFTNIEEDSDSSASGIELELQKYVEELRMSGSEHSEMDEDICFDLIKVVEMKPTVESPIKNKPMASTITRLQDTLNRPDTVFNITESDIQLIDDSIDQFTISDFTLLSEESWPYCVANMDRLINRFSCGSVSEDVLPLKVGSLEVINSNGCVTFHCHNCEFISTLIFTFGQHIKTHQYQFWDGKCTHCKTIYRKEHEEKSRYFILTTFCHLLESHLFKESTNTNVIPTSISTGPMRHVPPPPPVIPLAEYYESQNIPILPPKPPLLRVRRLSGDKLSAPAAENSLATNNSLQVQDIPANAFQGAAASDQNCYEAMQESCVQQTAEDEPCTFLRIESVVSLRPESTDDFNPSVMDGDVNVSLDESTALPCDRPRSYISLIPETSSSLDSNPRIDYQTPNLNIQESTPTRTTEVPTNSQLVSIPTVTKNSPNVSTAASKSPPAKLAGRGKSKDSKKSVQDYKTNKVYAQMLVRSKLRHFYKCMGRVCSFTCESMEKFAVHYEQHRSFQVQQDSEKAWRVCPYCFDTFECARDYCIHMKKEHGYSNMQCSYCFYRAATLGNVLYHQNTCHITEKMMVLECASQGLGDPPPRLVKFDHFIKPFVCGQGKCNFYTFIPETFRQHLQNIHSRLNNFRCHLCVGFTARLDRLVEHYRVHAIAMYQCLYCIHGETIEDLMREHLCYSHSNQQPSAVKRIDITKRYPSPTKLNLERLKRINFKELEEKTHTLIHYTPEENELPSTSSTSEPLNLPSTSNKVISSDDDIQIIQTINKSDLISEVICLESSDEDECMVINEQSPVISKKRTRPTENSDNSTNVSQGDTDNFDTPPSTKRSKEDFNTDTVLNVQPSTSRSDVTNIQDNSSDSNSNTMIENPKFGLTGSALFRCGNKGCDYGAKNSLILKDHMIKCELLGPAMICVHCNKVFKYVSSLIEHIRVHGTLRYRCSLCDFKGPVAIRVSSHMKNIHKISNTKVEPMNPREKDDDTDEFVCIPKVTGKGGKSNKKKSSSKSKTPTKFSLTDIDKIPYRSIFSTPLGCSSCTYETKVRSNLVQHLTLHAAGHSVPQEEMVNPVPCLEKKEKMFDKMMNLANSSHKNSDKFLSHEMEVYFPMYIPTNQRYVCHAKGCTYVTIDDSMLRYHIRTLHNEETTYRCPHCPSDDPASQTPIDKLSTHLKMHDTKLYACSSCNYYHFSRYVCEKHVHDRHPGLLACVRVIRETGTLLSNTTVEDEPKDEGGRTESLLTPPSGSAIQNTPEKKNWHCNLCKFRSEEQMPMRKHCNKSHGMIHQYKCRLCKYESDIFSDFDDHFAKLHPNLPITVITSFNKIAETPSTSTAVTSGSDNAQGVKAYWRRNTISVKHIRGILLDDEPAVVSSPPVISEPVAIKEDPKPESLIPLPHPIYGPYGEPSPENQFKCPRCNHTYRYKSEFKIHLCKELEYTPWVCTRCSKCYINKSSITKHARIVHDCDDSGIGSVMLHHPNKELEQWVETMFAVQKSLMKKKKTDQNRKNVPKKRKASVDTNNQKKIVPEGKKNQPQTNSQKISKEDHLGKSLKKNKKVEGKQNSSERKRNFMCGYCSTATVLRRSVRAHQLKKHPSLPSLILCSDGTPAVVRRRTINSNVPLNISFEEVEKVSEGVSKVEINNSEDNEAEYGDIPYYTCFYCKWSSKTISAIKDHWKFLHKDAVLLSDGKCKDNTGVNFLYKKSKTSSEQEYACKWCKKQGTVSVLKEHSIKEHVGLKFGVSQVFKTKYKCSKCNIIVNSVEVLKRHISSEHPKMQSPDENKSGRKNINIPTNKKDDAKCYKCPKCNYSSHIFKNAAKHLIKHGTSFKCGVCENVYRSLHGVRSHMGIKHPGSSVNAKVIPPSNVDIATIKKQIIVVKKISNSEIECTKFNKLQIKHVKATKTIVPPLGRYFSDAAAASNSKPKGSPSSVLSCKEKVLNTNPINQLKLNPSGNSKNLLKPKYFKIKNRTEGDKKTKSLTLKKTGFKTNESVTFTSNDKLVKLGLHNFTRLFNVHPKIHIEPLIVHP